MGIFIATTQPQVSYGVLSSDLEFVTLAGRLVSVELHGHLAASVDSVFEELRLL